MRAGRPREFDMETALNRAMVVFWRKGYEGASLPDLTRAMRISRPSLYAAFGNKESLFRKALDRYSAGPTAYVPEALEAPTARAVVERLLYGAVDLLTNPRHPRGCLWVQGALACGKDADPMRKELISRRKAGEAAMCRRFSRAADEGDLPSGANPADLARYVMAMTAGMSVLAAGGAKREELLRVVEIALRAWPVRDRIAVGLNTPPPQG